MKCMVRSQYAYYWMGKLRTGGDVVDISEEEYKKVSQIFEPPGYVELLEKKETAAVVEEEKVGEESTEEKIVEEGIIGNRAILKKPTRKRQG